MTRADAGHGGTDPGAVYQGRQEKDDVLRLAMAVGEILKQNGIDVVYTRTNDVYQTPYQKAVAANHANADIFVSLHRNASVSPGSLEGIETLVYADEGIPAELARNINAELEALGFVNRGVTERPGLVVLRRTKMPAVLVEAGFIDNESDNERFDAKFEQIAEAIADGILRTLDISEDKETANLVQTPAKNQSPTPMPMNPQTPNLNEPQQSTPNTQQTPNMQQRPNPMPNMQQRPNPMPNIPQRPVPMPNEPQNPVESPNLPHPQTLYRVQVGAYKNRRLANALLLQLQREGYPAFLLYEDELYKVQVGAFAVLDNAIRMERALRMAGYNTWITT